MRFPILYPLLCLYFFVLKCKCLICHTTSQVGILRNTPNNKLLRKSQLLTETQLMLKTIPFLREEDKDSVKSIVTHELHFFKLTGSLKLH